MKPARSRWAVPSRSQIIRIIACCPARQQIWRIWQWANPQSGWIIQTVGTPRNEIGVHFRSWHSRQSRYQEFYLSPARSPRMKRPSGNVFRNRSTMMLPHVVTNAPATFTTMRWIQRRVSYRKRAFRNGESGNTSPKKQVIVFDWCEIFGRII